MRYLRLIVTGSRLWHDKQRLFDALDDETVEYANEAVTVVHGMCDPRRRDGSVVRWEDALALVGSPEGDELLGADWWADRHARKRGWATQGIPANWSSGPQAGPRRNRAMINRGGDLLLGFPQGTSKGSRGCIRMAVESFIPVRTFEGVPLSFEAVED